MSGWLLDGTTNKSAKKCVGERFYPAKAVYGYPAVFINTEDKKTLLTTGIVQDINIVHGSIFVKTDDGTYYFYTLADEEVAP